MDDAAPPLPAHDVEEESAQDRAARLIDHEPHRRVQGMPAVQTAGLVVLAVGVLVYLHAVWATANDVLRGAGEAERVVSIGGLDMLQGTLGLLLALVGLVVAGLATWLPIRERAPLLPGTLEHAVVQESALAQRRLARSAAWTGLGLLLVGCLLAAFALRRTVMDGSLYGWDIGGSTYRIHIWGLALVALGVLVLLWVALRAVGRDDLVAVVQAQSVPAPPRRREPAASTSDEPARVIGPPDPDG